jgi:hypothetical protein
MPKRPITILVGEIVALVVVLMIAGCSRSGESGSRQAAAEKESPMKAENQMAPSSGKIPLIDAAAPKTVDTATFGLG